MKPLIELVWPIARKSIFVERLGPTRAWRADGGVAVTLETKTYTPSSCEKPDHLGNRGLRLELWTQWRHSRMCQAVGAEERVSIHWCKRNHNWILISLIDAQSAGDAGRVYEQGQERGVVSRLGTSQQNKIPRPVSNEIWSQNGEESTSFHGGAMLD